MGKVETRDELKARLQDELEALQKESDSLDRKINNRVQRLNEIAGEEVREISSS